MSTDKHWKKWGAENPYFGVISDDKYRKENLTSEVLEEFFTSGVEHVNYILGLINKNFEGNFTPNSVLDFGCGVGRLAIPFSRIAETVLGVDISPSMLEVAKEHSIKKGIGNLHLALSDDKLSEVHDSYSLIHSYIVFQHIPENRGNSIILSLAQKVEPNGFLVIHIFTESKANYFVKKLVRLRYALPPAQWVWNLLKKRPLLEPPMQLNCYNANHLEKSLKTLGFDEVKFIKVPSIAGFTGVFLVAKRSMYSN